MRSFEYALNKDGELAYKDAKIPEYQTKNSAGADFFCAEEVIVPSIWSGVFKHFVNLLTLNDSTEDIKPTLIHTGIKASMYQDEVLELYNRSSNPKKLGLVLANSVGVVDADYYGNPDNDGEIMFAFYNFRLSPVTIKVGDRIGQGVFKSFLRPEMNCNIVDADRTGGFGSTNK